ncbi:hypothetical protein FRB99_006664 [Tulasnella sp. 403]|nr:hypothetical protein FRB99_006664 [Tulasnella sp. 403]
MKTKPAVQYGKRAQRQRRSSHTKQPLTTNARDDLLDSDGDDIALKPTTPIRPGKPVSSLGTARSPNPNLTPVVEIPSRPKEERLVHASPTKKTKVKELQVESEQGITQKYAAHPTSGQKRKIVESNRSESVDSDDPLRLVQTPRKRNRVDALGPSKLAVSTSASTPRTPLKTVPYVEVVSPQVLFGSRPRPPSGSRESPHPPGTPNTTIPLWAMSDTQTPVTESPSKRPLKPHSSETKRTPTSRTNDILDAFVSSNLRTPGKPKTMSRAMLGRSASGIHTMPSTTGHKADTSSAQPQSPSLQAVYEAFAASHPVTPRKSQSGIAKRMLGRKTVPEATQDVLIGTSAGPSTPRDSERSDHDSPNPFRTVSLQNITPQTSVPQRDVTPPPSRPSARTYGKSRSFLVDLSESLLQPGESQDSEIRESYQELRDDPSGTGVPPNDLRSVTEMRTKGETRHFLDELGYLFEGIDSKQPLSVRRSSTIELIGKLVDPDFVRKARATDVLQRAWNLVQEAGAASGDVILELSLATLAAFAAQDARDITNLSEQDGFRSVINAMLEKDRSNDPFMLLDGDTESDDAKRAGIGKQERRHVSEWPLHTNFRSLIQISQLHKIQSVLKAHPSFPPDIQISCGLVASLILRELPSKTLRAEFMQLLIDSLSKELQLFESRVSAYTKGLALQPPRAKDMPVILHAHNCLKVVEQAISGRLEDKARQVLDQYTDEFASRLVFLCIYCEVMLVENSTDDKPALNCFCTAFQLLIVLADTELWAAAIVRSPWAIPLILRTVICPLDITSSGTSTGHLASDLPSPEGPTDPSAVDTSASPIVGVDTLKLDTICHALPLLTNLLQHDAQAPGKVGSTELSIECQRSRSCLRTCRCSSRLPALKSLVSLYEKQANLSQNDPDDAQAHFLQSHLAVMVALLATHPANRASILSYLPGSSDRAKIDTLIETIRDFMNLHVRATMKMQELLDSQASKGDDKDMTDPSNEDTVEGQEVAPQISTAALAQSLSSAQRDHEVVDSILEMLEAPTTVIEYKFFNTDLIKSVPVNAMAAYPQRQSYYRDVCVVVGWSNPAFTPSARQAILP